MSKDLKPYALRLDRAMPWRFVLHDNEREPERWLLMDVSRRYDENGSLFGPAPGTPPRGRAYGFFGPLMDEFKVRPHGCDGGDGKPGAFAWEYDKEWVEMMAEAVCTEVERRATAGDSHPQAGEGEHEIAKLNRALEQATRYVELVAGTHPREHIMSAEFSTWYDWLMNREDDQPIAKEGKEKGEVDEHH